MLTIYLTNMEEFKMGRIYQCPICNKKYTALQPMIDCAKKCEAQEREAEEKRIKQEAQEKLIEQTYADIQRVYKELNNKVKAYNRLIEGTNKTALVTSLESEDYDKQSKGAKTSTIKDSTAKKPTAQQEQDGVKIIHTDLNKLADELSKDEEFNKLLDAFTGLFI